MEVDNEDDWEDIDEEEEETYILEGREITKRDLINILNITVMTNLLYDSHIAPALS